MLGSMGVLVWSLAHVIRFNRLLRVASRRAGPQLQAAGHQLAHALGLKTKPSIHTTMAHLSPML